jgi:N6-adenosine-specific RNA methylase IME4
MTWPFGGLKLFSYDLAMVDPPWPFKMRSEKGEAKSYARHYGSMSFEEIAALPVGHLLAQNAIVFLWCTWPLLLYGGDPEKHYIDADASRSRVGEVIKAWGLRYVTGGAWHKKTKHGKTGFGTGQRVRSACEPFMLLVNGAPDTSRAERNLIEGLAREHSRKPEEALAWCERYLPAARRLELFSRQSRPGWDTWGLEAGKFDPVVHAGAALVHPEGPRLHQAAGGAA